MTADLTGLNIADLLQRKLEIEQAIENQKESVIKDMMKTMRDMNISLDDLKPAKELRTKSGKIIEPKYRNPLDATQVWTGRGKHPKWYDENLAKGYSEEIMRIV